MLAQSLAGTDRERGSWSARLRPGHPWLARHLAGRYVDFVQTGSGGGSRVEPPTGTVTVILNLGEPFGGLPRSFAAGIGDRPVSIEDGSELSCLDVKLTPLGAYTLLGLPMDEIARRAVDLEDIYGSHQVRYLIERLDTTGDSSRRFDLLDAFFLARVETGPQPSPAIEWAWRRLEETGGLLPIGDLAAEVGWSQRHLIAQFRRQIGLPPKRLARILRFSQMLLRLRGAPGNRWAELAYACGYYDQAHLNRDFREFAGTTPSEFLRRLEVNSFQDTLARAPYDRPDPGERDDGGKR